MAHKPMDYLCRAMPCLAMPVDRANGSCLWAVPVGRVNGLYLWVVLMGYDSGLLFFQKILISK